MLDALSALSRALSRLAMSAAGAGLVAMSAIIVWQVIARYVFNASPAWAEQASLVILFWFVFFAGAAGVREGFHIRIIAGLEAAPPGLRRSIESLAHLATLGVGAALAATGGDLVGRTWEHTLPSVPFTRGAAYLAAPISGALIVFFTIEQLIALWRGEKVAPLWS